ncbi:MAG: hypothetical protein E6J61_09050 [Deltaproteobacteria bacterium]|nr:MAG: hypothetical protein E6J61_09050 [Deltaproteobacteria bacterium]
MRVLATRAAVLLAVLAAACEPPAQFVDVGGHPGKRGIDGGLDGAVPPPSGPVGLTVTVAGEGRVYSRYFDCSRTCTVTVPAGVSFEVHAEGGSGSTMVGWTGACAGAAGCRIVLDDDAQVGAVFGPSVR